MEAKDRDQVQARLDEEMIAEAMESHGLFEGDEDTMPKRIDPDTKAKWVEALRSGKYTQGEGKLKVMNEDNSDSYYCCLGVLCEIKGLDAEPNLLREKENGTEFWDYAFLFPQSSGSETWTTRQSSMPIDEWLQKECGMEVVVAEALAAMNDNAASFDGIADWIERYL